MRIGKLPFPGLPHGLKGATGSFCYLLTILFVEVKPMSNPLDSATSVGRSLPIFRKEKNTRVLLIENNTETRYTLSRLLETQGYRVIPATTLSEAHKLIRFTGFNLILLNWRLEGISAAHLCGVIRSFNTKIPIYFYIGGTLQEEERATIEAVTREYAVSYMDLHPILKVIFEHLGIPDAQRL